ncbi:hypothetical protein GGR26_003397 [Lewinella marina]|uniref:Uncharacterized protein n=1 Tax=Neolewinella marina TaxID=438751 RepID=A0A2G0CCI7_9BACT|nr:hypothetical protein [Neolewinella marina]NJB87613.1 hypothetical protein [Neolewinella marina]PHK97699.1 hypothetical protein CGL56_14830 [Neolewinella marina]
MIQIPQNRTRAQESRAAVQRLYIAMRHLLIRGSYKPGGMSGKTLMDNLMILRPEIYGSITDTERVELNGLHYVFQRLPKGIEECRFIRLITREGYENSHFTPIVPPKRRREAYRIDVHEMYIEMTRGRSDIYDILTHLTFLYAEANKIYRNSLDSKGRQKREWQLLAEIVEREKKGEEFKIETAYTYLSTLLGRTYNEIVDACRRFAEEEMVNSLFHITYWLGLLAKEELENDHDREVSFSSTLREKTGHHYFGELWASAVKEVLLERGLFGRPLHVVSANLHSVMNALFAPAATAQKLRAGRSVYDVARSLSQPEGRNLRELVTKLALKNGMIEIVDTSGSNIGVQLFDTAAFDPKVVSPELEFAPAPTPDTAPVILVMDYAFGEQAYESMDELLRPYHPPGSDEVYEMPVESINIMGKAGILEGIKGDLMIPDAHIFEGTADNYPFKNSFTPDQFEGHGLGVYCGPMVTVLGTSLQNRQILEYFLESSWKAVGLEMEGAHYQKAIQAATHIRKSANPNLKLRYAYYASDNPLVTGHTLASGSLGVDGVKPTYLITVEILKSIFHS